MAAAPVNNTPVPHICLPVNLDAFVLNEKVCESKPGTALIAPITQPNYVNLRLSNAHVQHDVLPRIDLHNARTASTHPRISTTYETPFHMVDSSNPQPAISNVVKVDKSRLGVYLHWTIPRAYRSAKSEAAPPAEASNSAPQPAPHNPNPRFPLVPNRWLIVRRLHPGWSPPVKLDTATAWVIESDRLRNLGELDSSIDLETDVTPFVAYASDADTNSDILNSQAEKYIGIRHSLQDWQETKLSTDQRVKLTVMNSSNPLFADYAPHNANVFSLKDNFWYGKSPDGEDLYLDKATCDYTVTGWHSSLSDDPLSTNSSGQDMQGRLAKLFMQSPISTIPPGASGKATLDKQTSDRYSSIVPARVICHATKYDVVYSDAKPSSSPADEYAAKFTDQVDMEPVSIGTSPLDAVLAFLQAHQGDKLVTGTDLDTAKKLMGIRELLYAAEDDYDSRIKASDLVSTHNFGRSAGGFQWRYNKRKDANGPPIEPSSIPPKPPATNPNPDNRAYLSEVDRIALMNEYQQKLDTASRKLDQVSWAMFSEWFKYISDASNTMNERVKLYRDRVPLLRAEGARLNKLINDANDNLKAIALLVDVKKVARDPFFKRNDPTLCLAGIDSGWDPEYLNDTPTRYADRLNSDGVDVQKSGLANVFNLLSKASKFASDSNALPDATNLSKTLSDLLKESSKGFQSALSSHGHKQWAGQPFSPQFVEWEGIYYNIDWTPENWKIQLANSALPTSNHKQIAYVNPVDLSTLTGFKSPLQDSRPVSGRILVLPQPSFALGALIAQVLDGIPMSETPDLPDQKSRDKLIKDATSLKLISGEMDGLTDALLTMAKGQHVKPNVRVQGEKATPMLASVNAAADIAGMRPKIGMIRDDFELIAGETGRTPYGTLYNFGAAGASATPFKGVQHGQFAITKLVVVDKFGQTIACPYPKRRLRPREVGEPSLPTDNNALSDQFVHPCLSEQLIPSLMGNTLNAIYQPQVTHDLATATGVKMTPFVHLSPAINQEARINAVFLKHVTGKNNSSWWHQCSDWENPIFGWIVVNYADSALQFFTADGTYYTSRQFGGPNGTIVSPLWAPFEHAPSAEASVSPQLQQLIDKMGEGNGVGARYLAALFDIIQSAIPTMPFPPSDYAAYANAIVGKPLALVNAGWSLELSQPPYWRQHTLPSPEVELPIKSGDTVDPLRTAAAEYMSKTYHFKVKIGDSERPFDGVVAYWDTKNENTQSVDDATSSTATDFNTIWSYTASKKTEGIGKLIEPDIFPTLTPYSLDPEKTTATSSFTQQQAARLLVKTMLVDPYTPLHVYSGSVLPIRSMQLPSWTIQQAMKNMTAFFTMGPLLLSRDVPHAYDASKPLLPASWLTDQTQSTAVLSPEPINLPIAGGKGVWNWLQPYLVPGPDNTMNTKYNALPVGVEDGRFRGDPAPYTLVEGFLQLARPLIAPGVPSGSAATSGSASGGTVVPRTGNDAAPAG